MGVDEDGNVLGESLLLPLLGLHWIPSVDPGAH